MWDKNAQVREDKAVFAQSVLKVLGVVLLAILVPVLTIIIWAIYTGLWVRL